MHDDTVARTGGAEMEREAPLVDILLATCNGSRYLREQLDSLLQQTEQSWRLIVSDDRSDDATPEVIERFAQEHPGRVVLLPPGSNRLGACGNFARLLASATAPYFMFCDQDDVWLPEKVQRSVASLRRLEQERGADVPALVHTDLRVCDRELRVLAESFWAFQTLDPQRGRALPRQLMQNAVTGCALAGNRALRKLAAPIPPAAIMHDWWLGLVAVAFGAVAALPEQTILYRQHGANTLGAQVGGIRGYLRKLHGPAFYRQRIHAACLQARCFLERYADQLPPEEKRVLRAFSELPQRSFFARRWSILRHGFLKYGLARNLALFCVV